MKIFGTPILTKPSSWPNVHMLAIQKKSLNLLCYITKKKMECAPSHWNRITTTEIDSSATIEHKIKTSWLPDLKSLTLDILKPRSSPPATKIRGFTEQKTENKSNRKMIQKKKRTYAGAIPCRDWWFHPQAQRLRSAAAEIRARFPDRIPSLLWTNWYPTFFFIVGFCTLCVPLERSLVWSPL